MPVARIGLCARDLEPCNGEEAVTINQLSCLSRSVHCVVGREATVPTHTTYLRAPQGSDQKFVSGGFAPINLIVLQTLAMDFN
jgi:hypothetical protein